MLVPEQSLILEDVMPQNVLEIKILKQQIKKTIEIWNISNSERN